MEFKVYDKLPDEAIMIRTKVFVDEQGFNEEFDSTDRHSRHIVIFNNKTPAAVGRFFTDDGKTYHIGRVAVTKEFRGFGYGKKIMDIAEKEINKNGGERIELSAQLQAKKFYEKCGYTATGDIYLDEHCEHILMYKNM
ncbi:MAG: GNAT family N-acetyltransferase [Eubacterium sp.]